MNDSHDTTKPPGILEAQWDMEQVDNLFHDLQRGADVQHVQVRTTADGGSQDRAVTLSEAQRLLHCGEAKAIQVRYEFDNQSWCDTLMIDTLMIDATVVRIIRTSVQ